MAMVLDAISRAQKSNPDKKKPSQLLAPGQRIRQYVPAKYLKQQYNNHDAQKRRPDNLFQIIGHPKPQAFSHRHPRFLLTKREEGYT
jgi:hypothetical protein